MAPTKICSFCGKSSGETAQLFASELSSEASSIAICDECVLTCAKAVDVEQRLSERPHDKPPGDATPDSERPAPIAEWDPFQVGSLQLEWRAEPAVLVRVRRADDHERSVIEHFAPSTEPTIDDAETVAEDYWELLHG